MSKDVQTFLHFHRYLVKQTHQWRDGCSILLLEEKKLSFEMEWSDKTAYGTDLSLKKYRWVELAHIVHL